MNRTLQFQYSMEQRIVYFRLLSLLLFQSFSSVCAEGRSSIHLKHFSSEVTNRVVKHLDYSFPPSVNALPPSSSPQVFSPFCVFPPSLPLTPSVPIEGSPPPLPTSINPPFIIPNPPEYNPSPPEYNPNPPETFPGTPGFGVPGTPIFLPSPPSFEPSPPGYEPSPPAFQPFPPGFAPSPPTFESTPAGFRPSTPEHLPGPPEFVPGPPLFLPPVIFPPPNMPSPPRAATTQGLWCVAKPTVPDPIIQEAMNYACGSGADCDSIQPNGLCYQPDTLIAHASFAFNSYWQRTKAAGGTCDFGGTAMLVTRDPSYDGCHFS